MLNQSHLRDQFKTLIRTISASECSIIEPAIHSCIVTVGEELKVLRFGPGQEDFYVEMYSQRPNKDLLWSLTDLILGYKRGAKEIKHMTTSDQESIIFILESFRNLSPFSAAKLHLLRKDLQNNISAHKNKELVERICLADCCRDPNIEYKRSSSSEKKKSKSLNNTLQTASLETDYFAKWGSSTFVGDISSPRTSEKTNIPHMHSNEYTLSAYEHCITGKRGANAAEREDSTLNRKYKPESEYSNKVSKRDCYKDQVELVSSDRKHIADNRTISPTPCKNTLLIDFEENLESKTELSNILSQRKKENGDAVIHDDQHNSYNGVQVSFKDSVEVLVSVADENGMNETTPSLINNIADPFLTCSSPTTKDNGFKTSFNKVRESISQLPNSTDPFNAFFRSTELKKKRRSPSLLCDEIGCSYKARSRGELQQHRRKHTGERPISCEWKSCAKKFKDKSTYRVHYKSVHLKRRDYKCLVPGCEKTFGCAKSRNRHSTNLNLHRGPSIRPTETQS